MSDLRTRIITAMLSEDDVALMADAVIRELGSDCIYRYACAHCGDFWFDKSERMQRFALLHSRLHQTKDEHDKDGVWGCGQSDCKACY
jgi:hypothetical protein